DRMLPGMVADDRVATAKGMKIDKRELDELLREIVSEGALENSAAAEGNLVIEINGARQTSRPRTPEALRQFAARISRDGHVLPADHPHVTPQLLAKSTSGDRFYQSLESNLGAQQP